MTLPTIAYSRLSNQRIASPAPARPEEVVSWMGLIQAQDYLGALWAVGLRLPDTTEADIEAALAEGKFVRTWPARGTLHFAPAQDIRWMLELLAPRSMQGSAGRFRQLGLDEAAIALCREAAAQALQGGSRLTRDAMYRVFESSGISTAGQRGIHILGRLAQEGLICFGPREGKQHTFVLLAEWVPQAKSLPRDQALTELTRRYFTSHGPAMLHDFVWWSGLTVFDAKAGLEMAEAHLVQEVIDGQDYWLPRSELAPRDAIPTAHLLPAFDEYLVGYKDRRAILDPAYVRKINAGGGMLSPAILIDGRVVGTWKRTLKKGRVVVTSGWFTQPEAAHQRAFVEAAIRYGAFLNLPVVVE